LRSTSATADLADISGLPAQPRERPADMILDTSALAAILYREPESAGFAGHDDDRQRRGESTSLWLG
jgi:hypothetical protein